MIRAGLLALLTAVALAIAAAGASALVVRLPNGHKVSYVPLRGAPTAASTFAAPFAKRHKEPMLLYHGGPIMPSNTNYTLYWRPSGAPAYPADYQAGVNGFLEDLAHDSGGVQNVDSLAAQYSDSKGEFAKYDSHFGGALIDEDPYPPNGCSQAPICLSFEQLTAEIAAYVTANGLPRDLTHEYFLLTPPGVEDCFEETECSAGSSSPRFCAFHDFIPVGPNVIVYSNDPYVSDNLACDDGEHPNAKSSDGAIEGGLSHEHNESTTDPEISAWWVANGEENGDKCRTFREASEFGSPLGTAGNGSRFNQVINGHPYWYQQEFSNEADSCQQRIPPPTVKKLAPKKGATTGGTPVIITGHDFQPAESVKFGSTPASFTVISGQAIEAHSPPGLRGTVHVTVSGASGTSAIVRHDRFKYR